MVFVTFSFFAMTLGYYLTHDIRIGTKVGIGLLFPGRNDDVKRTTEIEARK